MVITLIGMSNVGKTYLAKRLQGLGFRHIECDALIEKELADELKLGRRKGIRGVADWLGQPYDIGYAKREAKYLQAEKKVLGGVLKNILSGKRKQKNVLDTTGSFIYLGDGLCKKVKQNSLILYLKPSKDTEKKLLNRYVRNPKPVLWNKIFKPKIGEPSLVTLRRLYPKLLKSRKLLYEKYADIVLVAGDIEGNKKRIK